MREQFSSTFSKGLNIYCCVTWCLCVPTLLTIIVLTERITITWLFVFIRKEEGMWILRDSGRNNFTVMHDERWVSITPRVSVGLSTLQNSCGHQLNSRWFELITKNKTKAIGHCQNLASTSNSGQTLTILFLAFAFFNNVSRFMSGVILRFYRDCKHWNEGFNSDDGRIWTWFSTYWKLPARDFHIELLEQRRWWD